MYPLDIATIRLPPTYDVFKALLSEFGITITDYSEKGRYANGIEEALGGIWGGAMILRDSGVRDLLYRLAGKSGEPYLPRSNLSQIIGEKSQLVRDKSSGVTPNSIIDRLIRKKVLRPGLEFKCEHCYKLGWYHVSQFEETFKCKYCFTEQSLPILDKNEWRYRLSGLFATENVGHGSLPVICTSLFFRTRFFNEVKHIYSFEFKFSDNNLG